MAISVQPVDGLIYRLLQQNSKAPSAGDRQQGAAPGGSGDHVNISSQARDQQPMHSVESQLHTRNGVSERNLESHLLNLYRLNDTSGG
ncbi:hypothetical protein FE236_09825 [Mariprofundus erugo]|uniref:Uncharacterized protein n=1 Tax=Mariprofundus erugo TaxID=2528639 RepID=A0A5R9GYU4_9PROT|nr:hypothetical protein [Mariprofundus erugo]TLS68962.1 hypothetical protein FEF65_00200 [Mariprofundus erugo]TLS75256.1 hypothetical protein FE236_09825 [Mariprofundus erugo]